MRMAAIFTFIFVKAARASGFSNIGPGRSCAKCRSAPSDMTLRLQRRVRLRRRRARLLQPALIPWTHAANPKPSARTPRRRRSALQRSVPTRWPWSIESKPASQIRNIVSSGGTHLRPIVPRYGRRRSMLSTQRAFWLV